ncbi:hypothetical protein ILYODFUR_024262 [Ilyodon furcidens]|uniref:Uncharacterized protein n=1 Tax=Ilyodon furcidens TaxID=33524 RepID=A0ABV0V5Q4_9TELE
MRCHHVRQASSLCEFINLLKTHSFAGLYGGAVGSTVALQQEGPGVDSWPFSLCMRGFSPGTPASSHCMVVCVLPCDGLVTPPPAHRLLERSSLLVQIVKRLI